MNPKAIQDLFDAIDEVLAQHECWDTEDQPICEEARKNLALLKESMT